MDDNFLWNQFAKLGEMMGDGLHHEDKWISKEYKRLSRILMPEMHAELRKSKNKQINERILRLISATTCVCNGTLIQSRSGSKVVICSKCNKRYKLKAVKNGVG